MSLEIINLENVKGTEDLKYLSLEKYLEVNLGAPDEVGGASKWNCLWHDDKHASMTIISRYDGRQVVTCPVCNCDGHSQDIADVHRKIRESRDGVILTFQAAKDELFINNGEFEVSKEEKERLEKERLKEQQRKLKLRLASNSRDLARANSFATCNPLQQHFLKRGILSETILNINSEDLSISAIKQDTDIKGKAVILFHSKNQDVLWKKGFTKVLGKSVSFNCTSVNPIIIRSRDNNNSRITICEGVEDALSIMQIENMNTDTMTLNGTGNVSALDDSTIVSKLSKYREILILLDNDKGGHTATEKLIGILTLENGLTNVNLHPIGAYLIDSNYNDVNEYLVNLGM